MIAQTSFALKWYFEYDASCCTSLLLLFVMVKKRALWRFVSHIDCWFVHMLSRIYRLLFLYTVFTYKGYYSCVDEETFTKWDLFC